MTRIQISHGADREDPNWFVVLPLPGETRLSPLGAQTNEQAVESLRKAGRSIYELEVEPWQPSRKVTEGEQSGNRTS